MTATHNLLLAIDKKAQTAAEQEAARVRKVRDRHYVNLDMARFRDRILTTRIKKEVPDAIDIKLAELFTGVNARHVLNRLEQYLTAEYTAKMFDNEQQAIINNLISMQDELEELLNAQND